MKRSGVGIVLLAAGASVRMGFAKQSLRYEGCTLLQRAVKAALGTGCRPVIVVLGSDAEALRGEITGTAAQVVINQAWAEGMSASIRCGLAALEAATAGEAGAVLLMLCDQPFITEGVLNRLLEAEERDGALLVTSEYETGGQKTRGVPALFGRALFPELMKLRGTEGAKHIITRHLDKAVIVSLPEAAFDVDTPSDYQALLTKPQ